MTNKELAKLMYPRVTKTIDDYEKLYPERQLKEGAIVSRFAPSPTGFVHMGSLLTAFIERKFPKDTGGVFYLRIEDTDQKRSVENGIQGIIDDLANFDITIDEGVISETEEKGAYGPYIQTKRQEIYDTYAKYMVENDYAYPCFCSAEDLEEIRGMQEKHKHRIGYYGKFAKCRNLTNEERAERIKNGESFVLRLKSTGDFNKKITINDCVRGKIDYPENDIDHVLVKSDGIPVYHFAHPIDDHLMRTTHIMRGEEWFPSTPLHIEIHKKLGFKVPKYAHLGLVMKIDEDGTRRKLSKRKDPEAAVSFYHEKGIPTEAVKLYLTTIANTNFEAWYDQNKDKSIDDFKLEFKKISASGTLFDLDKLLNISKNYMSRLKATDVYDGALNWANEFDLDFAELLKTHKEYATNVFNIEREQKKPRKDFAMYSEIKQSIWYMFKELFDGSSYNEEINEESLKIIKDYFENMYQENDTKDEWYNKLKDLADKYGYAKEVKVYKENPDNYKGHVGDICEMIRYAITSLHQTPDLYQIEKILGKEEINRRLNLLEAR